MTHRTLPCGCRSCGCACAAHSVTHFESPCALHLIAPAARFVAGEVAVLVTLALFLGMIGIWARILGG